MDTEAEKLKKLLAAFKEKRRLAEAELRDGLEREFERLQIIFADTNLNGDELRFIHKVLLCDLLLEEGGGELSADILNLKGFLAAHEGARFDPFDRLHLAYAFRCCRGEAAAPAEDFQRLCAFMQILSERRAEAGTEAEADGAGTEASEERGSAENNAASQAEPLEAEKGAENSSSALPEAASREDERQEAEEGDIFVWDPLPEEEFFTKHTPSAVRFFGRPLVWEKPPETEFESGGGWDKIMVLLLRLMTDKNCCSRYCSEHGISLPKLFAEDADFRSRRFRGMARQDRFNSLIKSEHNFMRPEYICEGAVLEKAAPHREKWELLLKILHLLQVDGEDVAIKFVEI
ncbi:hypothetical protein IJT93_11875 [bacterium]|nr:hypothetical protein [bacterium]